MTLPDALNMVDGAGMILPDLMEKIQGQLNIQYPLTGFQICAPWIKGAVFPFNFMQFSNEHDNKYIVTDIDKKQRDIKAEGIQVILTESQFKTHGKYNSWKEYVDAFKRNKLSFSVTNINNQSKGKIQLAYQFLQTLDRDKATEENISDLCEMSINYFKVLHNDVNTVFDAFGVADDNPNKEPFQEALALYPALLNDKWVKKQIEEVVASYKKNLLCGRIESQGFYGYAQPDMYGFCEWLFLKDKEPKGLIPDDSIYCHYYADTDITSVDVLRSPHLNNEHTVRKLCHSDECKKWFDKCGQNVIYSIRDYLMLCVQGDVDGDTLAVVPSKTLIDMIKPHDVLYYKMFKAPAQQINNENIYNTLVNSFACNTEGRSIGYIANAIAKCWNQDVLDADTLNLIKYLTMLSNFTIDFPKTQENIKLLDKDQARYQKVSDGQFPYFFKYVKNKNNVAKPNDSVINKIVQHIEQKTKSGGRYNYKVGEFDYSMLQSRNDAGEIDVNRSDKRYKDLRILCYQYGRQVQFLSKELKKINDDSEKEDNECHFDIVYSLCLIDMLKIYQNKRSLTNALIDLCYCQKYKPTGINNIIWRCVGDNVVFNILSNLGNDGYKRKTKTRMAYRTEDIEKIVEIKSKLDIQLEKAKPVIYQHDIETMQTIKNTKYQQIYYVLLCLCKLFVSDKAKANHKVYIQSGKKSRINNSKILTMAGLSSTTTIGAALKSLQKSGLIKIDEQTKQSNKIISLVDYDFNITDDVAFAVNNAWNPIIYYKSYFESKNIGICIVCGHDYLKEGNCKTCSVKCKNIRIETIKKNSNEKRKIIVDKDIA
jgi:hypothetical protein